MPYLIIQTVYWLALATWFGGVLFVAIAAPIIFRTVRENNPILPNVLSVNLEHQHSSLLAGTVVGNILSVLSKVQFGCAAVLLIAIAGQWLVTEIAGPQRLIAAIARSAMYIAAVVMVIYDTRVIWPKIWHYREEYIEHADEPEIANPAKEQFDRYHRESVTVMSLVLFLLLGMILFSGLIAPATRFLVAR